MTLFFRGFVFWAFFRGKRCIPTILPTSELRYKFPNEIGNHRQISQYVTNYRNELRLFTNEVEKLIVSVIPDHVVVFPKKMT